MTSNVYLSWNMNRSIESNMPECFFTKVTEIDVRMRHFIGKEFKKWEENQ